VDSSTTSRTDFRGPGFAAAVISLDTSTTREHAGQVAVPSFRASGGASQMAPHAHVCAVSEMRLTHRDPSTALVTGSPRGVARPIPAPQPSTTLAGHEHQLHAEIPGSIEPSTW